MGPQVSSALAVMARQSGVMTRGGLVVQGWKDCGGHFVMRASHARTPDEEYLFEAEQVLVCPSGHDLVMLKQFGLSSRGLQCQEVLQVGLPSGPSSEGLPVWSVLPTSWRADSSKEPAGAHDGWSGWGGVREYPGVCVAPLSSWSTREEDRGGPDMGKAHLDDHQPPRSRSTRQAARRFAHHCSSCLPCVMWASDEEEGLLEEEEEEEEVQGSRGGPPAAPLLPPYVAPMTSDGYPVLGYHPGLEQGRLMVALCPGGPAGSSMGVQSTQPGGPSKEQRPSVEETSATTSSAAAVPGPANGAARQPSSSSSSLSSSLPHALKGLVDATLYSPVYAHMIADALMDGADVEQPRFSIHREDVELCAHPMASNFWEQTAA